MANRTRIYLRLTPPRNGRQSCINLADRFIFDGAVAQLARATRWQRVGQGFESPQLHLPEANGSPLPAHQTAPVEIKADAFRERLDYWIDRVAAGESPLVS
jgi:hypothetical protein